MVSPWLFPVLNSAGTWGTPFDGSHPLKIVWHTTEIDPNVPASGWIPNWKSPSHIVADVKRREIWQCVPLDRASKALWNSSGGVETNNAEALQVEIHWLAHNPADPSRPDLSEASYRWLGEAVLRPLLTYAASVGSPINTNRIAPPGVISGSAAEDAPQRMSFQEWDSFDGICSHRHVPENGERWDVGLIDLFKITAYAVGTVEESLSTAEVNTILTAIEQLTARVAQQQAAVEALRLNINTLHSILIEAGLTTSVMITPDHNGTYRNGPVPETGPPPGSLIKPSLWALVAEAATYTRPDKMGRTMEERILHILNNLSAPGINVDELASALVTEILRRCNGDA